MVCMSCGKVKNRIESYFNLSLPVKDLNSVHDSLKKQVEGEIINGYRCDGCGKEVDLSKRTLIAETPNILIVHLQRICFNFDTLENDKLNSLCKFPNILDLTPYTYFDVMEKENRLGKKKDDVEIKENEMTEAEIQKAKEAAEEAKDPERDDCFEYKLVGVNVHSGAASFGHYWSYINTNRGYDDSDDPNWHKTEKDPWMEFNDASVSDWDFKNLAKECYGNENSTGFFSAGGDSYGTSGYMLFYERRKKKDLKIVVPKDEVD